MTTQRSSITLSVFLLLFVAGANQLFGQLQTLSYGQSQDGNLAIGQTISYQTPGTADDVLTVTVTERAPTTTAGPCIEVLDPKAVRINSICSSSSAVYRFRVFQSGYLRLNIFENGRNQTLNFTIRVACEGVCSDPPGPQPTTPTSPVPIDFASPKQGLLFSGQRITFEFPGTADDVITGVLSERDPTTTAGPCIEFQDPRGNRLASQCGSSSISLRVRMFNSGIHKLIISENGSNQNLAYLLRVSCTGSCQTPFGPPPPGPGAPPVPINPKQTINGLISTLNEVDRYYFDGVTDDNVTIRLAERDPTTLASTCIRLRSPSGAVVGTATGSLSANLSRKLTERGRFQIEVYECQGDQFLAYALSLDCTGICPIQVNISGVEPSVLPLRFLNALLKVTGEGFQSGARVLWNETRVDTRFVSANEIIADVPRSLTTSPGTANVRVENPNGSVSNGFNVTVQEPGPTAPRISSISPNPIPAGSRAVDLSILGNNFRAESQVIWNDQPLPTRVVSTTEMTAVAQEELLRASSTGNVLILNPQNVISLRNQVVVRRDSFVAQPGQLEVESQSQGGPVTRELRLVGNQDAAFAASVVMETGGTTWLRIDSTRGTFPSTLPVTVEPSRVSGAQASGRVVILSPTGQFERIEVPVRVSLSGSGSPLQIEIPEKIFTSSGGADSLPLPMTITNKTSTRRPYKVETSTRSGVLWLGADPSEGEIEPGATALVSLKALGQTFDKGFVDIGTVAVKSLEASKSNEVGVGLPNLTEGVPLTTPTGMSFDFLPEEGRLGGEVPIYLINPGLKPLAFSVESDQPWLFVTPQSGELPPSNQKGNAVALLVQIVPPLIETASLSRCSNPNAGTFCGTITVVTPFARIPISITSSKRPASSERVPIAKPSGLVFAPDSAPQTVEISLFNNRTVAFSPQAPSWISVTGPSQATNRAEFRIEVDWSKAPSGTTRQKITWAPNSAAGLETEVMLVNGSRLDCLGTRLFPVVTSLPAGFVLNAGSPYPIALALVDDCGKPVSSGVVVGTFSNGDQSIIFVPVGEGRWQGTWRPTRVLPSGVEITIFADAGPDNRILGNSKLVGSLLPNTKAPNILEILDSSGQPRAALRPGQTFEIRGTDLAVSDSTDGVRVLFDSSTAQVIRVGPNSLLAVVPEDLEGRSYQIRTVRESITSLPTSILIQK